MKHLILFLMTCTWASLAAQTSGYIEYTETQELSFELPEGMELSGDISNTMESKKALFFNGKSSVYKDVPSNISQEKEMTSEDGSIQIRFEMDETENIMFLDHKTGTSIFQTGFMGKEFLIESDIKKKKWKISPDKIKYLGYVCQKATATETIPPISEGEEEKERSIVVWFTSEIPAPIGPSNYTSLPGAILMVSIDDGKTEIKATKIDLEASTDEDLVAPTKGQKVTSEEFSKLQKEKLAEMREMYQSRGGESIFIRG